MEFQQEWEAQIKSGIVRLVDLALSGKMNRIELEDELWELCLFAFCEGTTVAEPSVTF